MTERASRLAAWGITAAAGALLVLYIVAVISALSGCAYDPSGTGGDNAPEARDAGVTDKGFSTSPAAPTAEATSPLAVALCQGECQVTLGVCGRTPSDVTACQALCPGTVRRLPEGCVDEYLALRFCRAGSPAPIYSCSAGSIVATDPGLCATPLIALTACRIGSR